jgi:CO/xanthine dehydrogenase Mo-binding subunit
MAQQQNTARGLRVVGTAGPPIDAIERVTGQAKYVGDLELPGMLVARVLRTRHAHARIVSIDTSRA